MAYFVILAGESSGDTIGSSIIHELKKRNPNHEFKGIAGPKMIEAGCEPWFDIKDLSVMGIANVLKHIPRLLKIRKNVIEKILNRPPDAFIGIDYPEFNLSIESKLKQRGIKTVHVVSPSFWAWRENRVKTFSSKIDLMLCLFPFEEKLLRENGVNSKFIGHPLADKIPLEIDKKAAKKSLKIQEDIVITLMPGSRRNEIKRIAAPLLKASLIAKEKDKNLLFICALIDNDSLEIFKKIKNKIAPNLDVNVYIAKTHQAIESSDIVMLASGTATLESMLLYKPMIVAYKMSWLTYLIVKLLAKLPYASIPNILANDCIVPECLQYRCTPKILASELDKFLNSTKNIKKITSYYEKFSKKLRKQADYGAANAVLQLIENDKLN